jgi:hypothetical protein
VGQVDAAIVCPTKISRYNRSKLLKRLEPLERLELS